MLINNFNQPKLETYLEILLEERTELGKRLLYWMEEEHDEHNLKILNSIKNETQRIEKEIKELLFVNKFKKELLTEKEE